MKPAPKKRFSAQVNEDMQGLIVVDIYVTCDRCLVPSTHNPDDGFNMRKIADRLLQDGWELRDENGESVAHCRDCAKEQQK